ncbi:MAG: FGGY-family carbohydrate kinase [Candidatus Velthaea sp.]|jgi:xylulokinase
MDRDLVIGVDSSTQSTKVIAWNAAGAIVAESAAPIAMASLGNDRYEQDPRDWWGSFVTALQTLFAQVDARRVAALAIANQRETMAPLDATGAALRPAMLWLDERGRPYLPLLAEWFGARRLHQLTGKPIDLTPTISRLAWMRDHEPELFARTVTFTEAQAFLVHGLTGEFATSWASSDPSGVFDIEARAWSEPILAKLDLDVSRFPRSYAPGTKLGETLPAAAAQTGLRPGTPIIAGGGDGQCAGLGTNCVLPGRAYLNLGTAIVSGVWSATCACTPHWRTLISASGRGYVLETVQRSGVFLMNWFRTHFVTAAAGQDIFEMLESAARALPIGSDGLLTLPYWSGCMNPHWDPDARGCLIGFTGSHGAAHVYRSILEGLTLESARAASVMEAEGIAIDELVVIGGGARSPLWVQMVADATERPARICQTVQASALGAGMLAAYGAGWFATIEDAAAAMSAQTTTVEPNPANAARYAELMALQGSLYAANAAVFAQIRAFKTKDCS